jgi:purine-binding chemotaxis protein CheW
MANVKQTVFQIGDEGYSLDIMKVITVEKYIPIEQKAKSPANMKGIIRLRGDVIPVYSLRSKFGLEDKEPGHDTRFIITNANDMKVAYEVDKMQGIVTLEPEQINEVPSIVKNVNTSYMEKVVNIDGRLIIQLDPDGILTEEEQKGMKAITASL